MSLSKRLINTGGAGEPLPEAFPIDTMSLQQEVQAVSTTYSNYEGYRRLGYGVHPTGEAIYMLRTYNTQTATTYVLPSNGNLSNIGGTPTEALIPRTGVFFGYDPVHNINLYLRPDFINPSYLRAIAMRNNFDTLMSALIDTNKTFTNGNINNAVRTGIKSLTGFNYPASVFWDSTGTNLYFQGLDYGGTNRMKHFTASAAWDYNSTLTLVGQSGSMNAQMSQIIIYGSSFYNDRYFYFMNREDINNLKIDEYVMTEPNDITSLTYVRSRVFGNGNQYSNPRWGQYPVLAGIQNGYMYIVGNNGSTIQTGVQEYTIWHKFA